MVAVLAFDLLGGLGIFEAAIVDEDGEQLVEVAAIEIEGGE